MQYDFSHRASFSFPSLFFCLPCLPSRNLLWDFGFFVNKASKPCYVLMLIVSCLLGLSTKRKKREDEKYERMKWISESKSTSFWNFISLELCWPNFDQLWRNLWKSAFLMFLSNENGIVLCCWVCLNFTSCDNYDFWACMSDTYAHMYKLLDVCLRFLFVFSWSAFICLSPYGNLELRPTTALVTSIFYLNIAWFGNSPFKTIYNLAS